MRSNKPSSASRRAPPEQPTDSLGGSGPRESTASGRISEHCSSTNNCEQGGGKVEKKSTLSIVPSASSIVLDFLEQSAKQKIHESQMTSTPAPAAHTSATAAAAIVNADMSIDNHTPATAAANAADGNDAQSSAVPAPPPQQGHKSVVPQLMDIYDDLTQSSTPQTVPQHQYPAITAPAPMTSLPTVPAIPKGVYYSGSASSQASVNRSTQRIPVSRGQYGSGGVVSSSATSAPASVAAAATARSKSRYTKKIKAEEYLPGQQQASRKKGKTSGSDQRWSKRFTWPDALHRAFVSAIFDVGLKNCSPSSILEFMPSNPDITSERVKSHLQKYRLNRQKSREEFMSSYDSAMEKFRKRQQQGEDGENQEVFEGSHNLSCGEAAAFCTNETLTGKGQDIGASSSREGSQRSSPVPGGPISSSRSVSSEGEGVGILQMPLLTVEEKDGPIGQAFGHLVGMFQALSQQLEGARQKQGAGRNPVPSSSQVVSSSQNQVAAIHHQHYPHPQQPMHQPYTLDVPPSSLGPPIVEQAAVTAASLHANDPSIHEVAAVVPHAFLVQGRPAVHASSVCGYSPASQPQQHQAQQPPQHAQYPQVGQAHAPPTTIQHPSSHYTGVTTAPVSQGEYTQAIHHPQPTQHAQAPHPAYARQHMPAPAPVSHAVPPTHHYHQVQPPAQKYAPSSHQHPQDEIPTISYTIYQPQVHAPIHPPPPMESHHPGSALGPPRQAPAPARHHSSSPQTTHMIQTYANQAAPDQQHHQLPVVPSATASQHSPSSTPAPTRAPIAVTQHQPDSSQESNVNHSLPGTGRTLQAQKESSMMKQEMRGQMLFQNKMRALKQIELSKYGGKGVSFSSDLHTQQNEHQHDSAHHTDTNVESVVAGASPDGVTANHSHDNNEHTASEQHPQATTEQHDHSHFSVDLDQDLIWNPEDDDQIFDFLMEH